MKDIKLPGYFGYSVFKMVRPIFEHMEMYMKYNKLNTRYWIPDKIGEIHDGLHGSAYRSHRYNTREEYNGK